MQVINAEVWYRERMAPPYSFRLVFDPQSIDDRMTYGLRARIEMDGQLLFTSTEHIDPFAGERGEPVRIMVSRQGRN